MIQLPIAAMVGLGNLAGHAISTSLTFIIKSFLTEKVILKIVIGMLEKLVKSTNNSIDDQFVKPIRDAYDLKYKK